MTGTQPLPLPTSAFGIAYQPPSGSRGAAGQGDHKAQLKQACEAADDDTLTQVIAELDCLVANPPASLSQGDLRYYETCLWSFSYEYVRRCFGGDPDEVAQQDAEESAFEDMEGAQESLDEYCDELRKDLKMTRTFELALHEYQQRLGREYEKQYAELSESWEINESFTGYPNDPPPEESTSCGGSNGQGTATAPDRIAPEDAERVLEAEQELIERVPEYQPQEDLVPTDCESNDCTGYFNGKGEHWFCDQLVAGVCKPRNEGSQDGGMDAGEYFYGTGQLTYAAWGNGVTVTVKAAESAATEAGKATLTVFGATVSGIGIGAGVIDLGLCARRWYRTGKSIDSLKELLDTYTTVTTDQEKLEKQVASYALKKKKSKIKRSRAAAAGAAIGVIGGIVGVTALATNPVGWGIALGLGITAVLIGAGLLAYRGWRKHKRKKRAEDQRNRLIRCYYDKDETHRQNADRVIRQIEANEGCWVNRRDREIMKIMLGGYTKKREEHQRQAMASAIVGMFVEETRRFQQGEAVEEDDAVIADSFAGAILEALHLKPDKMGRKLLQAFESDAENNRQPETRKLVAKWVGQVMGKLKSW